MAGPGPARKCLQGNELRQFSTYDFSNFFPFSLEILDQSGYNGAMKTRSIYQKSLRDPREGLLKKGSSNKKLGFKITASKWKGKRLYSLTLEERTTCPTSCHHWDDCYGNNMPFAHRFKWQNIDLFLEPEIDSLMQKHKDGIVIRLHVLGDFFSGEYVSFWEEMLYKHPKLCIFGYTAREENSSIGKAISLMNMRFSERCVIRHSGNKEADSPWSYAAEESFEGKSFDCPEQTGKLKNCASCGLCWITNKTVRFQTH